MLSRGWRRLIFAAGQCARSTAIEQSSELGVLLHCLDARDLLRRVGGLRCRQGDCVGAVGGCAAAAPCAARACCCAEERAQPRGGRRFGETTRFYLLRWRRADVGVVRRVIARDRLGGARLATMSCVVPTLLRRKNLLVFKNLSLEGRFTDLVLDKKIRPMALWPLRWSMRG